MKRIFSVLLASLLTLGLYACGGKEEAKAGLQVGFARESIHPSFPIWLSGGGDPNRISTGFLDYLMATCVAVKDRTGNTYLIYTTDLQSTYAKYVDPSKDMISKATGVPVENIMIHGTHTHSSPGLHITANTGMTEALTIYQKGMVKAAQNAIADLAPATISAGNTSAPDLVFVRHYEMNDGTYAGSNYGDWGSGIKGHVYEQDATVQLVRFEREGDKKDVLLMNLGSHATFNGSTTKTMISADFPSPAREYVEKNADCHVAYFMAAGGDQVPSTKIPSEDHNYDYRQYGEALGKIVVDALPNLKSVESGDVRLSAKTVTLASNKPDNSRLAQARETYDAFLAGSKEAAAPLVKKYGFVSVYEARAIVTNASLDDTYDIPLWAMSIGDQAFVFAPYEMFSENGRYIRENSPYDNTFIVTMTNDSKGYIPSKKGYEIVCYEAYSSRVKTGSGEELAQHFVDLLTELKNG